MSYITKTYLETQFKNFAEKIKSLLNNKVDKVSGKGLSTNDYTTTEKNKLSGIATGAEVNQNAFSNIVVGSTTISADSKTDSLTLAGSNVTITPDADNDKVTIGITKSNVTSALGYTPPTTNTTYSDMTGATTDANGTHGLVPAPTKGAANRYLRSDGTWSVPPDNNTTYSDMKGATSSAAGTHGLVPAPASGKQTSFLRGDGTWAIPTDTKKFTYTVYNSDTLKDWIENKSGNDYTSVLIKKGTHSYIIKDINNFISVSKQGTLYIEGEEGSRLYIDYNNATVNSNYFFIIGGNNKAEYSVSTNYMSINNVDIYLFINGLENSNEYYCGILKYANGISNCKFANTAYDCKQVTLSCYYGCTNLNNCEGYTGAEYPSQKYTPKTGYVRLRPFYGCSRVINCYASGKRGYAGGAFYNGDHIINCNAKFEYMYYGETFYNVSHVIGCRSYASVGIENGGYPSAYKNCKKMLYNYAAAGSYSGSYASADTDSIYLCANTLNGGWNS